MNIKKKTAKKMKYLPNVCTLWAVGGVFWFKFVINLLPEAKKGTQCIGGQ